MERLINILKKENNEKEWSIGRIKGELLLLKNFKNNDENFSRVTLTWEYGQIAITEEIKDNFNINKGLLMLKSLLEIKISDYEKDILILKEEIKQLEKLK
jgi:hypothetical protein